MSRNIRIAAAAVALTMIAAGCQNARETTGALVGTAIGAAAGSKVGDGSGQVVATAIGAAVGLMVGANIGRKLDEHAQMTARNATVRALDTATPGGPAITWEAPNAQGSGGPVHGTVSIARQGALADGRPCREYVQTVNIGGEEAQARGTACRDAYGEWVIVDG